MFNNVSLMGTILMVKLCENKKEPIFLFIIIQMKIYN